MAREVVWTARAALQLETQAEWYRQNKGADFETTFRTNIIDTVSALAAMPTIGQIERQSPRRTIRSFLTHPKCRIIYWYTERSLYIIRLRFTQMQS